MQVNQPSTFNTVQLKKAYSYHHFQNLLGRYIVYLIDFKKIKMDMNQANRVLAMLDRINKEIDVIGNIILKRKVKPVPVPVRSKGGFRFP